MSDKRLDEQLMAHSETLYKLACAVGKLEAERDALQAKLDKIAELYATNEVKCYELLQNLRNTRRKSV